MDDDSYCFYCQRQFRSPGRLRQHLERAHKGTYAYYNLVEEKDDDEQRKST